MALLKVEHVRALYSRSHGQAWEPRDPFTPGCNALVGEGYCRRVDGRCGFEAFKDAMLEWTEAAHNLFRDVAP